jgi:hypothetical protein
MAVLPMQRHINCSYCCHACYLLAFSDVRVDNFNPAPLSAAGVLFQNVTIK